MPFARDRRDERMDDPELDPRLHEEALAGLRRINRWSFSVNAMWHSIRTRLERRGLKQFHLLDLACGSGDVSLELLRRAIKNGYQARLTGVDKSPVAIAAARQQASRVAAEHLNQVSFMECDVLRDKLPTACEIVMTSLFLHHLDEDQAVQLLERMRTATSDLVLVDDLRRTRLGYWLAWFGSRLLSRSSVVHFDGPVSVAGAFTTAEVLGMAEKAGLHAARIRTHWPQRFLLEWTRVA